MGRVTRDGRHLSREGAPFRVKGVTYGGFARRRDGFQFPERRQITADLVEIARAGLNTVRTYTLPPPDLLDTAEEAGLQLIVGLHYHDWRMEPTAGRGATRRIRAAGRESVAKAMDTLAGRESVLAIAIGNEVPVDLVRLHGAGSVEDVLSDLVAEVHAADPAMLATYVNFPTTEFLEVEGQDLACFNIFLEQPAELAKYLAHLQVVSGERPLLVTELGLAGDVHGESAQAESLRWQLREVDEAGCAGATVFSWTDEWAVNDEPVTGWGFGLVTEDRRPKPALTVVSEWAQSRVSDLRDGWPSISVIVCAYNEEPTIEECLASLEATDYPNLEVIVCDDGSTDRTLELARRFPFKVLELEHGGLSRARNAGLEAATGEFVAYLDADAACHPEWPYHLALSFEDGVAVTGGPNIPFDDAGLVERAVALSPGGPVEVLVSPSRAEHVPGCNMAFRKAHLERIGGFNPAYTSAGDDVDVCWKLLDAGEEIGFAAAAQVTHHRRNTVRGYLSQQRGYGRAERMLSGPHRHRFNLLGQARWLGFLYGGSRILPSLFKPVIYSGYAGMAPFQPITRRRAEAAGAWITAHLPLALPFGLLAVPLALSSPWWLAVPAVLTVLAVIYGTAVAVALPVPHREATPVRLRAVVGALHVAQPIARLWGRIRGRPAGPPTLSIPTWTGDRFEWLTSLRAALLSEGCSVSIAEPGVPWDLRIICGPMAIAHLTTAVAWQWEPRYRIDYRVRPIVMLLAVVGVVATVTVSPWFLAPLILAGAPLGVEILHVRRRIHRAIDRTTHASHP